MNSKIQIIIISLASAIITFLGTYKTMSSVDNIVSDSSYVETVIDTTKYITIIDSLQIALDKKPKIEVRYIPKPFPVLIKGEDSVIVKDSTIYKIQVVAKYIEVQTPSLTPVINEVKYGDECYIISKKDNIKVRLNKKYFKEGDSLFLFDGENTDQYLCAYYNKSTLKKKIKLNKYSVYSILVSSQNDADGRLDNLIKNKNKF